jgi:hypothetical protein
MFADVIQEKETPRDAMRIWAQRIERIARRGDEV